MSSNSSVDYYNSHAEAFIDSSINADVSLLYNEFEKLLKDGSYILDLGCGSGRDSKHFLENGYKVLSADPSEEMCKQTFLLTYNDVVQQSAEELKYVETFDAVWACASLLHVAQDDMKGTLEKVFASLKPEGILYASWKYGFDERLLDDGRLYSDFTEEMLNDLLQEFAGIEILKMWMTDDVRENNTTRWINVLVRKNQ